MKRNEDNSFWSALKMISDGFPRYESIWIKSNHFVGGELKSVFLKSPYMLYVKSLLKSYFSWNFQAFPLLAIFSNPSPPHILAALFYFLSSQIFCIAIDHTIAEFDIKL